ncbi:MAG: STAS domain-containing protein [Planctomycetes bacterium]|nr:STAS domain-containing protein [Planctomycetota bacterium]
MSELVTKEKNGVLVIGFTVDTIRSGEAVQRIGEELLNLAHSRGGKVLLDLGGLQQMPSLMIGKIIALGKECADHQISLRLCNLQPHIKEVFKVTGLDKTLKIHDSEESAMAAFQKKGWFW